MPASDQETQSCFNKAFSDLGARDGAFRLAEPRERSKFKRFEAVDIFGADQNLVQPLKTGMTLFGNWKDGSEGHPTASTSLASYKTTNPTQIATKDLHSEATDAAPTQTSPTAPTEQIEGPKAKTQRATSAAAVSLIWQTGSNPSNRC